MKPFLCGLAIGTLGLVAALLWWPVSPPRDLPTYSWASAAAEASDPADSSGLPPGESPRIAWATDVTTLLLRDPEGWAVGGAEVWVMREDTILASGWADDAGYFLCRAEVGEARVVAIAEGFAPLLQPVKLSGSLVEVAFQDGPAFEAFLEIDGALAVGRHELLATSREIHRLLSELPLAVREDRVLCPRAHHLTMTWEGGARYRLRGVAGAAPILVRAPPTLEWRPSATMQNEAWEVRSATRPALLSAESPPMVTGRVVGSSSVLPVPYALVRVRDEIFTADQTGQFAIPLHRVGPADRWSVSDATGQSVRSLPQPFGPRVTMNMGDLFLAPSRECIVRCVDHQGIGIAGVRVTTWTGLGNEYDWIPRTDETGAVTIRVAKGAVDVIAAAPRRGTIRSSIPAEAKKTTLTLERAARLEVVLLGAIPEVFPLFTMSLSGESHCVHPREVQQVSPRQVPGGRWSSISTELHTVAFDTAGAISVADLAVREALTLEVKDPTGEVVYHEEFRVKEGEDKRVVVRVDAAWQLMKGRLQGVSPSEEAPIFASRALTLDSVGWNEVGLDGACVVPARAGEAIAVEFQGPRGPLPTRIPVQVPTDGSPFLVAPASMTPLQVFLNSGGRPTPAPFQVRLTYGGGWLAARARAPAEWEFLDRRLGANVVRVFGPGVVMRASIPAVQSAATIEVPPFVPLRLRIAPGLERGLHMAMLSSVQGARRWTRLLECEAATDVRELEAGFVPLSPLCLQVQFVDSESGVAAGDAILLHAIPRLHLPLVLDIER